jgi:glycosyltransferase involved in cell wall biosynthesis
LASRKLLIDGREFAPSRRTGIARFLEGIMTALMAWEIDLEIILAISSERCVPSKLRNSKRIKMREVPLTFFGSEKALTDITKAGVDLFLSPYPKLPFFGSHCPAANTIHDVLYITHPTYKKRFRNFFDLLRLKSATRKACLTWYDSEWSFMETEKCAGFVGENPKIRHLAIDERFTPDEKRDDDAVLKKYQLQSEYIIVIGNGLPHKNLGVLLRVAPELSRDLVFIGLSEENRKYWQSRYPDAQSTWIEYIDDEELPALIRGAFCLAQPSTAEGYGYPPLEAMASGTPSVISNIPVLIETTGGHSLAADPSDSKMWIKAFQALEEKGFYQTQVEKGLTWVAPLRGQKGWRKHVADIEELLKGL